MLAAALQTYQEALDMGLEEEHKGATASYRRLEVFTRAVRSHGEGVGEAPGRDLRVTSECTGL